MSEHDEIIAEARKKYTVHHCGQCEFRKSCDLNANGYDSNKCREIRQSIMLGFGIEDGYFTKLLDKLKAAHKRDIEDAIASTVNAAAKSASEVYEPHIQSAQVGNNAKMREALEIISRTELPPNSHVTEEGEVITFADGNRWLGMMRTFVALAKSALAAPPRYCDVMSLEAARKLWFLKEIVPRLYGDLPLGKEVPFEEWFVSKIEQEAKGSNDGE